MKYYLKMKMNHKKSDTKKIEKDMKLIKKIENLRKVLFLTSGFREKLVKIILIIMNFVL